MKNMLNHVKTRFLTLALAVMALLASAPPAKADISADITTAISTVSGYATTIGGGLVTVAVIVGGALFASKLVKRFG